MKLPLKKVISKLSYLAGYLEQHNKNFNDFFLIFRDFVKIFKMAARRPHNNMTRLILFPKMRKCFSKFSYCKNYRLHYIVPKYHSHSHYELDLKGNIKPLVLSSTVD